MKKLFALVLVFVMIFACFTIAGCGQAQSGDKTYIIYSDNAFAPFEYLDESSNTYVGVDMDIFAAIAKDQNIKYEMHNEGFDASMGAVQSGQADGMIAGMTINDERKKSFDFSEGYFNDGQCLVVKKGSDVKSFDDLKGKKVACKTSTAGADYAQSIKDQYGFTLDFFEGSNEMYQAVLNSNDVACFEDFSVVSYAIKEANLGLEIVSDVVNAAPYGFAVMKGSNPELIESFNKGLADIKASGEYDKILAKYGITVK